MGEERGTSERNMGDEYGTGIWWRNLKEEHIYCRRNHGGEILEEKPWRRNHGGENVEEKSLRDHAREIMQERSSNHGRATME